MQVVGASAKTLRPRPRVDHSSDLERFDRQVLLFGAGGQARLRGLHVGVLGAGGGGSILIERLAHLGVGTITAVDPEIVERAQPLTDRRRPQSATRAERKKVHAHPSSQAH